MFINIYKLINKPNKWLKCYISYNRQINNNDKIFKGKIDCQHSTESWLENKFWEFYIVFIKTENKKMKIKIISVYSLK